MRPARDARPIAVALLAAGIGGCAFFRLAPLEKTHPKSYAELVSFAPECAHPSAEAFEPCDDAAAILEAAPRRATELFRSVWRTRVLGQLPDSRYSGVSPDPLGDAQQRELVEKVVTILDRTVRPALARVLDREPGPYAAAVKSALASVQWTSRLSFETFDKAEEAARLLPPPTPTPPAEPTPVDL